MISDDLPSLYAYDRWANARIFDACRKVPDADYRREPVPGWASLHDGLFHLAGAARLWSRRFEGETFNEYPPTSDYPTIDSLEALLDESIARIEAVIAATTPEQLKADRIFQNLRGDARPMPFWAALRHVVNHATYHRGQIAAKLKRLGFDPPETDFSAWARQVSGPTS